MTSPTTGWVCPIEERFAEQFAAGIRDCIAWTAPTRPGDLDTVTSHSAFVPAGAGDRNICLDEDAYPCLSTIEVSSAARTRRVRTLVYVDGVPEDVDHPVVAHHFSDNTTGPLAATDTDDPPILNLQAMQSETDSDRTTQHSSTRLTECGEAYQLLAESLISVLANHTAALTDGSEDAERWRPERDLMCVRASEQHVIFCVEVEYTEAIEHIYATGDLETARRRGLPL